MTAPDDNRRAFLRFCELLDRQGAAAPPELDIRDHILSLAARPVGVGYTADTLTRRFGANMRRLFPQAMGLDETGFAEARAFLVTGAVDPDPARSHKGAVRALARMPDTARPIFFEAGFLATSHSWSHAFRDGDPAQACLGYVYDDIAHYYMADRPNRLIRWLNSARELSDDERARTRTLIDRLVARRISKYNAQPMAPPALPAALPPGPTRRVLVCDQARTDASIRHGRLSEADFERMLLTALAENPDAQVIVKTHPDTSWTDGDRPGHFSDLTPTGRLVLLRDPVNPFTVLDLVDTVYVGTSQLGLEALFAGKKVVTFGAPFYAGWGLTDDRQTIPHRARPRRLEDLFHAFYVWYTIYHVPGAPVPARIEDALDYIEAHRPCPLPPPPTPPDRPPRVSVVIPVHGVAPYIERCIASVQAQTLREVEIIPVNDCSPDAAQAIIDRLARDDPRIRPLVLDENLGQGPARNRGIAAARGIFLWFIDGDDWMARPDALARLVAAAVANGADMVRGKKAAEAVFAEDGEFLYERPDPSEAHFDTEIAATTYAESPVILHNRHFWTWLYRRDWLIGAGIRFATPQWEERAFLVRALLAARVVSLTAIATTTYRVHGASTAHKRRGPRDFEHMLTNFETTFAALDERGAADRASPLRGHLEFHLSQFVDHMLTTGPYRHYRARGKAACAGFLERIATRLRALDFRPDDFRPDAVGRARMTSSGAYPLAIAALRAGAPDLLARAVDLAPIPQARLYRAYLTPPEEADTTALQDSLNRYARNDRVQSRGRARPPARPPRIVVHIGMSKTGTTWLQHLMELNRPALLRQGIWYPEVGLFRQPGRPHKQAGHSGFAAAARQDARDLRAHLERGLALMDGRIHTIVLSSEAFFLQADAPRIARYFQDYPIEIVTYLRRQDDWANAQYAEFVAGGAVGRVDLPFAAWLNDDKTRARLDYHTWIGAWEAEVGRDRIRLRLFDPGALREGDLLSDFAEAAGLPMLRDLPRPGAQLANAARLSAAHVELIRLFNSRPFRDREAYFSFIETVTTGIQGWRETRGLAMPKPWVLTPALSAEIMERAEAGNRALARAYFGQDGPLFPPAPARPPNPDRGALHPEEIALVAAAYEAAAPATGPAPMPARALGDRVVNYGLFGWRLWLLTPVIDRVYVRRVLPEAAGAFRAEPAAFTRRHWAAHTPLQVGLMYPNAPALGLSRLWVPVVGAVYRMRGKAALAARFRRDPILFMRQRPGRAGRLVGRLLFPCGELRTGDARQ